MSIIINFVDDFETYICKNLANQGFKHLSDDREVLFIQYCNLLNRRIIQHKRNIQKSDVFECPKKHVTGLQILEKAIIHGANLMPWQSKNILNVDYVDSLAGKWEIRHLHLGEVKEDDSVFMVRTGFVLYCIIEMQTVYFIQILEHGEKQIKELLTVARSNWPDFYDAKNIADDIKTHNVIRSDPVEQLQKILLGYEDFMHENTAKYFRQVKRLTKAQPDSLEFHMVIDDITGIAYAEESQSKMQIKLGPI